MLNDENIELEDSKEVVNNSSDEPSDAVKKPKRKRRAPAKKRPLTGPWPKIAIAAIILCLVLVVLLITMRPHSVPVPPSIQNISISDISNSSAVITWKTSEPATGQVVMCESENCTSTKTDESLFVNHALSLTDIQPNTRYQMTVISRNAQGAEARITLDLTLNTKTTIVVGAGVGDVAPDFTLPALDGKQVTLSQFRGKTVLLNFWETTCPACEEETAYIQTVYNSWSKDKLEILAVSGERAQFVQVFLDTRALTFPVLLDNGSVVKNNYRVASFPTTFFIDSDGIIKAIKQGRFNSQAELETMLNSL